MYLSNTTEKLQIVLAGAITTSQLNWITSYQDITSAGMTLPQSSSQGNTNSTTDVDMVAAPAASTTRQVVHMIVYNADTAAATVTIKKDISGTDYLYVKQTLQSGDSLQWSREDGFTIISGTSQAPVTFSVFTASGTWTKPAGLKAALICCVGAGGGAGSGARNAAGTNRFGGGAGGGGAIAWSYIAASALSSTVTVTVGASGTGGAAQTVDTTNGVNGTAGGDTDFGGLVVAKGGGLGTGGTTTAGTAGSGGSANSSTPSFGPFALTGQTGGGVNSGTGGTASNGFLNGFGCASGSGGSGITSANVAATTANIGGGVYELGLVRVGPSAGTTPNGSNNKSRFLHFSNTLTSGTGIGTGGAGGYPSTGTYNGGNGGYGAGGGGGAASLNGTNSGKGGDGGGGLCIVMNIF